MNNKKNNHFGKKEQEIVNKLTSVGYKKSTAKVIVYFISHSEGKAREIERIVDIRQPEVSIGVRNLKELNLLIFDKIEKQGKGRPQQFYKRKDSREGFIAKISNEIEKKKKIYEDVINYLNNI